ncbi:K7_00860p [Saccharomyces cerevisiae Kyokai no. 7]|uniref:K7_00860p n=1 Tax=Saccharomyces cerevisiae (strain Kyokai no. 7 / NBRC 101557) TaxID=721032 RepID=G2WAA7_YEASK|nr:K7_00860p [Saccharomyces cerevisiae Kyokai no. 7]
MMIIIFIELCRIADSLLWIPKSLRRTSSTFYIPNIIALLKMESQQLSQNSPTLQNCQAQIRRRFRGGWVILVHSTNFI